MPVLGISDSHNAAAVLCDADGTFRGLQEERPSRVKNAGGVPRQAIAWLLQEHGLRPGDIVQVALADHRPAPPRSRAETVALFRDANSWSARLDRLAQGLPWFAPGMDGRDHDRRQPYLDLGFRADQLSSYDHHACHAAAAYFGWGRRDRPVLVLTCDGEGDGLCATVNIGRDGGLTRLIDIDASHSLGLLYSLVTYMTGMVPGEHEYKLMGMAPYAVDEAAERVKQRLLSLFAWDKTGRPRWRRRFGVAPLPTIRSRLQALFFEERFDAVMGGTQRFLETMLCEWVRRAIRFTGIAEVALAGGVFMNVKANKAIMELEAVRDLFVFPSCDDETNAIGALYLASARHGNLPIPPLRSLYLGPDWTDADIAAALTPLVAENLISVERPADLDQAIVDCLVEGCVVGRFAGREEFGARSLGNRALLADPRNPAVVRKINGLIKNRDFWMPFASSILDRCAADYLVNPRGIPAPSMILSFDTTAIGASVLAAGIHPADASCRPQVVCRQDNPAFWTLIDRFRQRTGVGALLNTSLNLHGLPLAHRPGDALQVLMRSDLARLAIGPFLVAKIPPSARQS
jgi:carbamoyltransferase